MKPGLFQQLILYRYRYVVGYGLLALFAVAIATWQLSNIGPGINGVEQSSAMSAATWHVNWQQWQNATMQVVNLPYILLQKASIAAFGLSTLSIRVPSVIIGLVTTFMFAQLMRRLYRPHVAVLGSVFLVASSWYISLERFGAAYIMVPFVWTLATYGFVRLIRLDKLGFAWAALAAFAAALALYTPYGIYALTTGVAVVLVHPTARRAVTGLTGPQIVLGLFILIPLLLPLGWGLYKDPSQMWQILGLSSDMPTVKVFTTNLLHTFEAIAWRAPIAPELRLANLPLLGVGAIVLMAAGIYRCIRDWRAMRTQFILVSIVIMAIIVSLNPAHKSYAVLVMPVYMLVACGVTVLFREWYKLFPRNPYARSFALIPIAIFLGLALSYSYQQYFVAWARTPATYQAFSTDLELARHQIAQHPSATVVVPASQVPWYTLLSQKYPAITVTSQQPPHIADKAYLISHQFTLPKTGTVTPVANDYQKDALRFWMVTPAQ